jgi:hypothetical protein
VPIAAHAALHAASRQTVPTPVISLKAVQVGWVVSAAVLCLSITLVVLRDIATARTEQQHNAGLQQEQHNGIVEEEEEEDVQGLDDVNLRVLLGVQGPIRNLFLHPLAFVLYVFAFLCIAILFPLLLGRSWALLVGYSPNEISWALFSNIRHFALNHIFSKKSSLKDIFLSEDASKGLFEKLELPEFLNLAVGYLTFIGIFLLYVCICTILRLDSKVSALVRRSLFKIFQASKVCFLLFLELAISPMLFGFAMDLLTLNIRKISYDDRKSFALKSPITSIMVFWFLGFSFMVFLSMLVSLLRRSIRTEIVDLVFRNPDDPDFEPIREMLDKSIFRSLRRILMSIIIYLIVIIACIYLPCRILERKFPQILPFMVDEKESSDMPVDFLMFHVSFPIILDKIHFSYFSAKALGQWFHSTSRIVGLEDYFMPNPDIRFQYPVAADIPYFRIKFFVLLLFGWASYLVAFILLYVVSISTGRLLLDFLNGETFGHDLYSFSIGLYIYCALAWTLMKIYTIRFRINFQQIKAWLDAQLEFVNLHL